MEYIESADLRVEAPVVLAAAGPWAPYVSQLVDVYLPIFPARSQQLMTPPMEYIAGPFTIVARWDFYACQSADGRVQFGGTPAEGDPQGFTFRKRLSPELTERVRQRAPEVFPALANAPLECAWVGTREWTPDMMPIVGPVESPEGFFVCAGFSGHGFCLGPYAGQLMAEWIVHRKPSLDLSPFHYQRFQRPEGPLAVPSAPIRQASLHG